VLPTALKIDYTGGMDSKGIERMPENLAKVAEWLATLPGPIQAFIAACIIAPLRVIYDGQETRRDRIILESVLCGCIAYGVASGAEYFSVPHGVGVFIGSSIGFAGVVKFRELALAYIVRGRDK